jgi:flagellar biosynthesis/type III secretory pathway chaperone
MTINYDSLIGALRDEVQEYGELLSLFNDQQAAILERNPGRVLEVQDTIKEQLVTISDCRKHREKVAMEFAIMIGAEPASTVRELIDKCDEAVRPLLNALIHEVNQLISKTRRRGHQNQMLLARSIEVSQQILQRLNPGGLTKTYSRRGQISLVRGGAGSKYLARS